MRCVILLGSHLQVGGPYWDVPLGRRDSLGASIQGSNNDIPAPNNTLPTIITKFKLQGLDVVDVVALSGKLLAISFHTVLVMSRCTYIAQHGTQVATPSVCLGAPASARGSTTRPAMAWLTAHWMRPPRRS